MEQPVVADRPKGCVPRARDMVLKSAQYVIAQQAIGTVALETRKYV
jgi:hypothetical protein